MSESPVPSGSARPARALALLSVALAASPDTFYALASGYSGISLSGMGDLAVDAACELFNVINGHFSSQMRAHGSAVSIIDPPRYALGSAVPAAPCSISPSHVRRARCSSWHRAKNFFHNYCFLSLMKGAPLAYISAVP